ncbi:MAG: hypothetical protein HEQ20_10740 [Aphanizomenon flos-aquae KM1D3_PB]|uniref:hypothetical protein n=1 Tax=Aphanizomenon flos-aquae TaxID=1176 RepID=UPI000A97D320|nr:hypothetical protein [Aphanizomenon flos-aquae]QSV71145.1 MAG: hypothetical protein HEQ20_10740 [Aphanizomenon flos-aquae KM1D3_PB]
MSLWQGKRQEARGKSEEGLGDFTFLYTVWFYCVHLLRLGIHSQAGYGFYVKLTPMITAKPLPTESNY